MINLSASISALNTLKSLGYSLDLGFYDIPLLDLLLFLLFLFSFVFLFRFFRKN